MELYANPNRPDHTENNAVFCEIVNRYPQLSLFKPSPEKAPWHVQGIIDMGREPQLLNFWPHTLKGQRDGYRSVSGRLALIAIIEQAIEDAQQEPEPCELFEPFDAAEG